MAERSTGEFTAQQLANLRFELRTVEDFAKTLHLVDEEATNVPAAAAASAALLHSKVAELKAISAKKCHVVQSDL